METENRLMNSENQGVKNQINYKRNRKNEGTILIQEVIR